MKDTATLPLFDRTPTLFAVDPPKLRAYQSRSIQALRDHVRAGKRRILLVLPTGGGKTVIIAAIVRTSSVPVLFIAHRMELIDQAVKDLAKVGITNVGVIRGDDKRENSSASVQVASVDTLRNREKPEAGLVLIDEAHRAVSDTYTAILEHYKHSVILGFTATPTRLDGRPLGNQFDCLEVVATYQDLIKGGFVVEPLCYTGPIDPDLSTIKLIGGDYDEEGLSDVMRDTSLVGGLLNHWLQLAHLHPTPNSARLIDGPRRRTFVFAVSIQHSLDICERFESSGIRIAHLDGKTSETERKRIVKAIGTGDLEVVSNVGVLLEGVDVPSVKCILHARPTQSLVLWRQSCGRGLRPWNNIKPLLLDHASNIVRLGFPHDDLHWELHQKARRMEKKQPMRICKGCFAYLPAHKRICPYCDTEAPAPQPGDLPPETEEKLQQLASTPEAMRRMYYDTIVKVARVKGYKPGFAAARYKDRYGAWPPWDWSEQTRSSFASDPVWQENYEKHLLFKKKIEANKLAKELAKSGQLDPDDD
jgi:superfamily II DNA or RNA helicase